MKERHEWNKHYKRWSYRYEGYTTKDDHIDALIEGESYYLQFRAKSKKIDILQTNGFQHNIHILLGIRNHVVEKLNVYLKGKVIIW